MSFLRDAFKNTQSYTVTNNFILSIQWAVNTDRERVYGSSPGIANIIYMNFNEHE